MFILNEYDWIIGIVGVYRSFVPSVLRMTLRDGGWNGIGAMRIPVGLGDNYGENTSKREDYVRKNV